MEAIDWAWTPPGSVPCMKQILRATGFIMLAVMLSSCGKAETSPKQKPPAQPASPAKHAKSWLITLTAESGTLAPASGGEDDAGKATNDRYVLQLSDVDDQIVAFTDRPDRQVVVGKTDRFVEEWKTIFADDPPNAVLIQHDPKDPDNQYSVVVELLQPVVNTKTGSLEFPATILGEEHDDPNLRSLTPVLAATASEKYLLKFEDPSLFIDAFPTSVNDQITDSIT